MTDLLGMEWYKVHDEAERLEHSISDDVERKLVEKLGPNGACPHGNQINKSVAERQKLGLQQLWEATPRTPLRVDSIYERDRRLLEYFDGLGIRPGIGLEILTRNYDRTLTLRLHNGSINLGEAAARKIWVSKVSK